MDKEIKNEGQGRVFDNSFLEPLTKAPAWISASIYSLTVIGLLFVGYQKQVVDSFITGAVIYFGALLSWSFFEYIFHRYINHLDEHFPQSKLAHSIAYTLHGIHHEYPRDLERVIMPPVPGLMIAGTLYLVFLMFLGDYAYIFTPGFMTGYLLYTYVHFSVHKKRVPPFLKMQYRHHALHHYKYPQKAFGVTSAIWDRVFGTMPPE